MTNTWVHHFELRVILDAFTNNYPLKSRAGTRLLDWAKIDFSYQLLRRVGSTSDSYVGGELRGNLFYREYDFLDGHGWELQTSLNGTYAHRVALTEGSFMLPRLSVPVLGYLHRKPSLTYDETFLNALEREGAAGLLRYGRWVPPFDGWLAFEFEVLYHLRLSDRLNLQSRVGVNYYTIRFPERVRHLNVPLRCYLNYQW